MRDLIAGGRVQDALNVLQRQANMGDGASWTELGLLFLGGRHVPRDLTHARQCFSRAFEANDEAGSRIYIQFMAIGIAAPPDWREAVDVLRDRASTDEFAARQVGLLDRMDLSPDGEPAEEIARLQLSGEPQIWSSARLFSADECTYLIERARPSLQPSVIVDPNTGAMREHPVRTSYNASFPWISEDLVIHALNRRIAAVSGTAVNAGEPLQILRYRAGQQFRPHFDAIDQTDNQRVFTMLVYLNEDYEGGETLFTHTGLTFRGRTGDGLLFRNALRSGARDDHAQHAGLPIVRGEKWLASRWIRERPLVPPVSK